MRIPKEEYNELLKKSKYILGDSYELKGNDMSNILNFHNSFKTDEFGKTDKTGISVLIIIETYFTKQSATDVKRRQLTEKIYNWCWDNNIPIFNTMVVLISLYIGLNQALDKAFAKFEEDFKSIYRFDFSNKERREFVYEESLKNFRESFDEFMNEPIKLSHDSFVYQELIRNTYNEIRKKVKEKINNTKLPLDQYFLDYKKVLNDIDKDEKKLMDIVTNPRQFSKIKQPNHFLNHLREDFEVTEQGEFIFGKHAQGLSIGYTNKAIILSLDKRVTIRELKSNLKVLNKFKKEESQVVIEFSENLIKFIEQRQDVAKIIPFKALSKELGITKNQAKNYAKKLFSINEKSFSSNFQDITLLDT